MHPDDCRHLLDRHAARILARWRELLRALPPSSALANPDLLAPLMAPALSRIRQESSPVGGADGTDVVPVHCRCGLNPMAAFYLTGECATFEVLWGRADGFGQLAPLERERLSHRLRGAWRRIANDEIAVFCSLCRNGRDATHRDGESRLRSCSQ